MEVIEKARELGMALMEDERCKRLQTAKAANDEDSELQALIGEFNLKKMQLNNEFNKGSDEQSKERLAQIEKELKEVYNKIMANKSMAEYTAAKKEVDELLDQINSIIKLSVTGEAEGGGCSGNCSACSGCH
jgi:cell fate (sporulation/competence/biofilm development) regulator YlbF (YheA/YmcA/DUF963 family)